MDIETASNAQLESQAHMGREHPSDILRASKCMPGGLNISMCAGLTAIHQYAQNEGVRLNRRTLTHVYDLPVTPHGCPNQSPPRGPEGQQFMVKTSISQKTSSMPQISTGWHTLINQKHPSTKKHHGTFRSQTLKFCRILLWVTTYLSEVRFFVCLRLLGE